MFSKPISQSLMCLTLDTLKVFFKTYSGNVVKYEINFKYRYSKTLIIYLFVTIIPNHSLLWAQT